jgi:heptosyltransferase II
LPERVLVLLKPQFLGDAVMACPMIDSLISAEKPTTVMCGPLVEDLLQDRSESVRFVRGQKISGIGPVLRAAKAIRSLGVEVAYIVNRSFRSALAVRMAGVHRRVGHATEGRRFLLTEAVPYDKLRFEAFCYLDLLEATGTPTVPTEPRLRVEKAVSDFDFGIQPGARYVEKQVPPGAMAELARHLLDKGLRGVLLGGPEEAEDAAAFVRLVSRPMENRVGLCSIRETLSILAGLRLMAGSDTGLMHVAAAAGCPTITVFGPNPASKWGHQYAPHVVLEAPNGRMKEMGHEPMIDAAEQILAAR